VRSFFRLCEEEKPKTMAVSFKEEEGGGGVFVDALWKSEKRKTYYVRVSL
jgi:hypothetical protein